MRVGLDTSVVLRLLTGEPETQARRAFAEVQELLRHGSALLVSDLVISEVYVALQYHYGMPKAEVLQLLAEFLKDSGVTALGAAASVLGTSRLATAKPGFFDRLIHAEYARSTAEVITFEKSAERLPGARVLAAF